jgi:hypothetical protein
MGTGHGQASYYLSVQLENVMRKLVFLLVVALAVPAFAANEITYRAYDDGGGVLRITYEIDGASDDDLVGLGLTLSCSDGGNIGTAAGAVTYADPCLPVYLDYAHDYVEAWNPGDPCYDFVGAPGTPLADPCTAGVAADSASDFAICMGRLDPCQVPVKGVETDLVKIQLVDGGSGSTVVTITGDPCTDIRGGTVGSIFTVNTPAPTTVTFGVEPPCFQEGLTIGNITVTAAMVTLWNSIGQPDVWCCENNSMGDANLDGFVNPSDTTPLLNAPLGAATTFANANADLNRDGFVNPSDTTPILNGPLGANPGACPDVPVWPPVE